MVDTARLGGLCSCRSLTQVVVSGPTSEWPESEAVAPTVARHGSRRSVRSARATRKGRGPPRQLLGFGSRSSMGWSEGARAPSVALIQSGRVASTRAEACRPGPGLRPPPVPGLRTRGGRLPDPRGAGRLRPEHPRPAGAPCLDPGPGLRCRLLLPAHLLDVGLHRPARVAGAGRPGGALLRPAGRSSGPHEPAAVVAGLAGRGLGDDGALAHRMAVQRDAVGAAGLRRDRHPGGRRAGLRRDERPRPSCSR